LCPNRASALLRMASPRSDGDTWGSDHIAARP
jgi:hypothetical protein